MIAPPSNRCSTFTTIELQRCTMDKTFSEPKRDSLAGVPDSTFGPVSSRIMDKRLAGTRVIGFSLAGEESFVAAPEYSVCFDIGRSPREVIPIDNVCLSHGHMDHAAGIAYYLSQRRFQGNSPGRIIVHRGIAQAVQRLMDCWADIEKHHSPGQILGVEPLEDVTIRRGLIVRPFEVPHTSTSLGFSLIEVRHRLRPELQGKSGPELVALKRQGVAIDEYFEMSLLTFTGDTAIGRFLEHDFVQHTRGLLVECTFFERDHRTRAVEGRHIHVDDFPRVLEAVPNAEVMIIHHTRRTDIRLAKRILQKVIRSSDLARVSFLMDRPPRALTPRSHHETNDADSGEP
ncbi:MAG: MBL fold metallo-hydrolase [Planctomycetota bacterium]